MDESIYCDMLGNNYSTVPTEKPLGVHIHYGQNSEPVDFYSIFQLVETPNIYEYMGKKYRIPTIPTSSVPYRAHLAPGSYDVIALLHVFENEFLVVRGIEIPSMPSMPSNMGNINAMVNENKIAAPYTGSQTEILKPSQLNLTLAETIAEYARMLAINPDNKKAISKKIADLIFIQRNPIASLHNSTAEWISFKPMFGFNYSYMMDRLKSEEKIYAKKIINNIIADGKYNSTQHRILEVVKTREYIICQLDLPEFWSINVAFELPLVLFADEMFRGTSSGRYTDGIYEYELENMVSVKCTNEPLLGTNNIVAIINKNNVFIYFKGYIVDLLLTNDGQLPKTPYLYDAFQKMPVIEQDIAVGNYTNFPVDEPNVIIKRIAPNKWSSIPLNPYGKIAELETILETSEQVPELAISAQPTQYAVPHSLPTQTIIPSEPKDQPIIEEVKETVIQNDKATETMLTPLTPEDRIDQLEKALAFKNNLQSQNFLMDMAKQSCYDASWMLINLSAIIAQQDNGFMLYLKRVGEKTNRNNIMHCFKIPKTLVDILVSCGIQMTADLNCTVDVCTKARTTVVFDGMRYAPMILFWNADIIIAKLDLSSYFYANTDKFQKLLSDLYKKENLLDL